MKLISSIILTSASAQLSGFSGFQFGNNFEAGNIEEQKVTAPPTTTTTEETVTEAEGSFFDDLVDSDAPTPTPTEAQLSQDAEQMSNELGNDARSFHRLRAIATFHHPDYYTVSHGDIWKTFKRYGCWCWPDGKIDGRTLTKGQYQPVDASDTACQSLYECYRCVRVHHENKGQACDPVTTRYNMNLLGKDWDTKDTSRHSVQCNNDANTCERDLCECDKRFAEQYRNAHASYDSQYHQVTGQFDPNQSCQKPPKISFRTAMFSMTDSRVECCGDDPTRGETYRPSDKAQCCQGANQSFNPYYSECCGDSVVPLGTCGTR